MTEHTSKTYIPKFLTGEIKSPEIEGIENKGLDKNFTREEFENAMLAFQDDPLFKFLPYPRWFRQKHKALLGLTDDEKQRMKEKKEEFNARIAFETNQQNIERICKEKDDHQKEIMRKAKKRIKQEKRSNKKKNKSKSIVI